MRFEHAEPPQTGAEPPEGVTFIAGHRHYTDFALQATLFQLQRDRYLVRRSSLVLHSNK